MLETFNLATFSGRIDESFIVRLDPDLDIELRLVQVHDLGAKFPASQPTSSDRSPFSLHFRGPLQPILTQRIYPFEHPGLGRFEMFIVPLGPDREGMIYEAVFG
jgi:hypothetical protein